MSADSALSALKGVIKALPPVFSAEGLMLYGIGFVVYAIAVSHLMAWLSSVRTGGSLPNRRSGRNPTRRAAIRRALLPRRRQRIRAEASTTLPSELR